MVLAKYDSALKMRDTIEKIAKKVLNRERPLDKVARVVDVDRAAGIAYVRYRGTEDVTTRVKMHPGTQPQFTDSISGVDNGSIVRISGPVGSRYIAEILSEAPHQEEPRLYQPSISSSGDSSDTLLKYFSFKTSAIPPYDTSSSTGGTPYYVAVFALPYRSCAAEVFIEFVLDNDSRSTAQFEFWFDESNFKNTDIEANEVSANSYIDTSVVFNVGFGESEGLDSSMYALYLKQWFWSDSTIVGLSEHVLYCNILVKMFGSNISLIRTVDSLTITYPLA